MKQSRKILKKWQNNPKKLLEIQSLKTKVQMVYIHLKVLESV